MLSRTQSQFIFLPLVPCPVARLWRRVGLLPHIRQRCPQLLGRAEQRVLGRLFRRVQGLADRSQLQSLVMLHLENNSLTRSQSRQRSRDSCSQFAPHQVAFRTCSRPVVRNLVDDAVLFAGGVGYDRRIFLAYLALAQMIEAK